MASNLNYARGMTLKALLENPELQCAPSVQQGYNLKDKKDGGEQDVDFTSAFLGPQLWSKTYDISDFNLEYMDLDEFLGENGIPATPEPASLDHLTPSLTSAPPSPQSAARHAGSSLQPDKVQSVSAAPTLIPKVNNEEVPKQQDVLCVVSPSATSTGSTPPVSPLSVAVEFSVTEQDLALSSIPGHCTFDPTSRKFSEEELKPQPMIKKSRKIFVPEDLKDEKYWARRKKNNCAAKRSRDARRVKENQIAMRAAYLEKENGILREEMEKLRKENAKLKHCLSKYEGGPST